MITWPTFTTISLYEILSAFDILKSLEFSGFS